MKQPKILVVDLETLPNKGYFWHPWDDKMLPLAFIEKPKSICTAAFKFVGDKRARVISVKTPYDDSGVLVELMKVWEEADYVLAHYGDGFDIPFISARLLANKLPPLPLVPSIDTFKLAKKHFGKTLNSNRLDHLGEVMGVGRKNPTKADLWVKCANGNKAALKEMAEYNAQDVELLEQVWLVMLPYVQSKLNLNLFNDISEVICNTCGSENLQKRGTFVTKLTKRQRLCCSDCGSWMTAKYVETKETKIKKPLGLIGKNVKAKNRS